MWYNASTRNTVTLFLNRQQVIEVFKLQLHLERAYFGTSSLPLEICSGTVCSGDF